MRHDLVLNDLVENDLRLNTDASPRIGFAAVADDRSAVDQRVIDRDRRRLQRSEDGSGDALSRGAGTAHRSRCISRRSRSLNVDPNNWDDVALEVPCDYVVSGGWKLENPPVD